MGRKKVENRNIRKHYSKTIAIIGLGYVGLPLALLVDKKGYKVIGIDINHEKIALLKQRVSPFADENIIKELKASSLQATSDYSKVKYADIVIICVPTPIYDNHTPNLEPIKLACENIAEYLQKEQLIILESTVNPGVSENIILPILEKKSGLKAGKNFYLAHCPERVNPGDKKWNVQNIPRVVGSLEKVGLQKAMKFYQSIISGEIKAMKSLKEAEAAKIIENTFRDINIAFVNELAKSFDKLGIDLFDVIKGASTKPFAFLPHYPGCGIGGHCIPVDPYYLIERAQKSGFDHKFLKLAREINNSMPAYTVDLLIKSLNDINKSVKGTNVGVLGLSYKANIDDIRESPAYEIIKLLKKLKANIHIYDPFIAKQSTVKSFTELLEKSEVLILATAHKEFIKMDLNKLKDNKIKIVVDGRNCLDKDKIKNLRIIYKGIGR